MKNTKTYLALIATVIIAIVTVISCDKNLDKTDPNAVIVSQFFKNSAELQSATNSVYAAFHGGNLVGREWFFLHDTRSDEVATGGSQLEQPRAQLLNGVHDPTNSVMNSVWNALYTLIHRANTVIQNGPDVTDNAPLRDRSIAEAKFLRAWAYFELVSQWGGVPIYTSTVTGADSYQPRSNEDAVYTLIIQDLQDAATVLPGKSGYPASDNGRATKAAANALLGRVLMQKGDYAGAKTALLNVPGSGADGYSLTDRYLDNFELETEFSNESILEAIYVDKGDNNFNNSNSNFSSLQKKNILPAVYISPNPVKNVLHIRGLSANGRKTISIINVYGKLLQRTVTANTAYSTDVKTLATGMYYIGIEENNKITRLKFIKE